jgi:hypothetical protein
LFIEKSAANPLDAELSASERLIEGSLKTGIVADRIKERGAEKEEITERPAQMTARPCNG